MSAIRTQLAPHFIPGQKVLNLYAYTGAYSLFALKHQATKVISVDLSAKYLQWLETNLQLNPKLNSKAHESVAQDTTKFLQNTPDHFDIIICDPPSFSSNKKKSASAFKQYDELLPLIVKHLTKQGKAFIFLNTHSITKNKFLKKVETILKEQKLPATIIKHLGLQDDCPRRKGFPEGDYLKGFIIQKR
jgi:23S rRNA (cytosine1962-C5)-methyltransferase